MNIRKLNDRNSLLMYKQLLEKKERYVLCNYEDGPIGPEVSEAEIYRDTTDVSSNVTSVFADVLEKLGNGARDVSDISIGLDFSVFVDSRSINENGEYTCEPRVLGDKVSVVIDSISGHYDGEKKFEMNADEDLLLGTQMFTTNFSTLVIGLNKLGFELNGVSTFDEVKDGVLHGDKTVGSILLVAEKSKVYKKSEK